jgi:hypothetical protein
MGNCCSGSSSVPASPHLSPALLQQETIQSSHLTSLPLSTGPYPGSSVASTSQNSSRNPAHYTAEHDDEMTPAPSAGRPARVRSQDSALSQGGGGGGYPPPSSRDDTLSSQHPHRLEVPSRQYSSVGRGPPRPSKLNKSTSMDTTSILQGARSHSPDRMTRSTSAFLLGDGRSPTGTLSGSLPVPGTSQLPTERPERRSRSRSRLSSHLETLLPNDFRYVVRRFSISHYYYGAIVHRFRILVVGKVRVI